MYLVHPPLNCWTAENLRLVVYEASEAGTRHVAVDLSEIDTIDTTMIGMIVHLSQFLEGQKGCLVLVGTRARPRRIMERCRIVQFLELVDTVGSLPEINPQPAQG